MSTPNDPPNPYGTGGTPQEPGTPGPGSNPEQPSAPQPPAPPQYPGQPTYGTPPPPPPQYGSPQYGAAPQYGATPYQQPYQQPYGAPTAPPSNYLVWAILTTIFCCLPLGVVSIVFSAQVNSKWAQGDIAGALNSSKKARQFAMWSAIVGGVGILIYVIFVVVVAVNGGSSSGY